MSKKFLSLFAVIGAGLLSLGIVNIVNSHVHHGIDEKYVAKDGSLTEPMDIATHTEGEKPEGKYEENVVLVKTDQDIDIEKLDLDIISIDDLYPNSQWKKITLHNVDAFDAVQYLRKTGLFEKVDYNYIMQTEEIDIETIDVSSNPYSGSLTYIESNSVGNAWGWGRYKHNHGEEEIDAGGSPNVIVAVIDTGVDYNHLDLRNNIWINTAEIPGNDIDDDGNGYVDDVHGWDCVNEDNDPIDDNGHGTHVAGIVAAENNNIGTVGVAFNCKIMPVKAANSSGFLNNDDIAEAVTYAYMNGASVINMSFGSSSISMALQDVLIDAYANCSLIAAAGNSSFCNQPECWEHSGGVPFYPACFPFVVGVMSCTVDNRYKSSFTNFDHFPDNPWEYECYACGEQVVSTWPNNKYATLSGTSMSSPVVAGIAALLRSVYPDKDVYSSRYIHSQLTNTGTEKVFGDGVHTICDAYKALTTVPEPFIYDIYNFYALDSESFSSKNNGDGFIDAGETIKLGVELKNKGGKAKNVSVTIDTFRFDDPDLSDPNVEILDDSIVMGDIGTYSIGDGGYIYEDGKVVDLENGFLLKFADNTPNGYICTINIHATYKNGLDLTDTTVYQSDGSVNVTISSGTRIHGVISEDTTFTADKTYLIDDVVTIPEGVTVQFEEGCQIQFYETSNALIDTLMNTPGFDVYGELLFNGSLEKNIVLRTSEAALNCLFGLALKSPTANVVFDYCDITNLYMKDLTLLYTENSTDYTIKNSTIQYYSKSVNTSGLYRIVGGYKEWENTSFLGSLDNCFLDMRKASMVLKFKKITNSLIYAGTAGYAHGNGITVTDEFANNVFVNYDVEAFANNIKTMINDPAKFKNNAILSTFTPAALALSNSFAFGVSKDTETININSNFLCNLYNAYSDRLFTGNVRSDGKVYCDFSNSDGHDASALFPYITDVVITDSNDQPVNVVNTGLHKVTVTFSKEMDVNSNFKLRYGPVYPYADYTINGDFTSELTWEGEFEVKSIIDGGKQRFSLSGGWAKNDEFKRCVNNIGEFEFNIDVSQALSMDLQANPTEQGVELSWVQDDYETLMGYNVYRSESKDGYYTKLNSSIIPPEENTFIDDSCEPGITYWYTFTVVLSDFSESGPAGKVSATPIDTIAPTIYHTPVNQGYANNNLVINCTASDNIAVISATLYYRSVGETTWKTLAMSKANDRFSATIFGSEVTLAGIEYYISVTDGRNTVTRGSAENPYTVTIKDPSLLDNLGDVDGDGAITTKDALMIVRAINDELILTDDQFHRADLNKDGELSTFEALRILQYVNGNVDTLDMQ